MFGQEVGLPEIINFISSASVGVLQDCDDREFLTYIDGATSALKAPNLLPSPVSGGGPGGPQHLAQGVMRHGGPCRRDVAVVPLYDPITLRDGVGDQNIGGKDSRQLGQSNSLKCNSSPLSV